MFYKQLLTFLLVLLAVAGCDQNSTEYSGSAEAKDSDYPFEYSTKSELYGWQAILRIDPIDGTQGSLVGQHLTAQIRLQGVNGGPLENASLRFGGGMPGHGHGLPSTPQATAALGNGLYRVEGLKFNMTGDWVLSLGIYFNGLEDKATWKFSIRH